MCVVFPRSCALDVRPERSSGRVRVITSSFSGASPTNCYKYRIIETRSQAEGVDNIHQVKYVQFEPTFVLVLVFDQAFQLRRLESNC